MKNRMLNVTSVLMLIALITFSACKKNEEVNDPNIADVSYNKLYSVVPGGPPSVDSIDQHMYHLSLEQNFKKHRYKAKRAKHQT